MDKRQESITADSLGQWWIHLDGDADFDPDLIDGREDRFWTYKGIVNPAIVGPYLTRFSAERELPVIRSRANRSDPAGMSPTGVEAASSETPRVRLHHDGQGYAIQVQHTDDVWRPATAVEPGPYPTRPKAEEVLGEWMARNPPLERFQDYEARLDGGGH